MPWLWVLATALVILLVWLWRVGASPSPIKFSPASTLAKVLRIVVLRGVHKGDVRGKLEIFAVPSHMPTLVFTKSKTRGGEFGVTASIRRAALQEVPYERLRAELSSRRITFSETSEKGKACLWVEVGRDFGLALVLTQVVFQDVLGRDLARDTVGYMRDVLLGNHPRLTGVDAPNEEVFK